MTCLNKYMTSDMLGLPARTVKDPAFSLLSCRTTQANLDGGKITSDDHELMLCEAG